ncbi:MAG TPA: nucleotidyltransferase domain-containing protein [Pyrinomonadaceae bacterium]|nr:nucleotidyltransferase domain-containing protein [Pyrinomonadaceae bacterium]
MSESPAFEIEKIAEALHERLGSAVQAAYLYGSVARGCRTARDLDLLFVIASEDQAAVFAAIADIQIRNEILIHPTVVSPRELESNPLFRELVDSSAVLW